METIFHKSFTRGRTRTNWLNSYHTFSFGGYYNPERMNFGVLRVINDDVIAPGSGFPIHPHDNMEIITVPISGVLEHRDSKGHKMYLQRGDVQVMSAGTGIFHSEYNVSKSDDLHLYQIWVSPDLCGYKPRYDQKKFDFDFQGSKIITLVSPGGENGSLFIHSNSWLSYLKTGKDERVSYSARRPGNGLYIFVISGLVTVIDKDLEEADGLGLKNYGEAIISSFETSELLLFDIPVS